MSVDGFVAGPEGQLDWIGTIASDQVFADFIVSLVETSDTMILGRKTANEIVNYWEDVAKNQPDSPEHSLAQKIVSIPKIAFSKHQSAVKGKNVKVENGDLATAVKALKNETGKDIIVYGGVQFVSALVEHNLIDEYHFLVNPVSLGNGLGIFKEKKSLALKKSVRYDSGIVVNTYVNS